MRRWEVTLVAMAALPLIAAPAREQRNYRDTTWWDPPVTNITDADTYLRRKFRQDVTDKSTGLGQQELLRRLEDISISAMRSVLSPVSVIREAGMPLIAHRCSRKWACLIRIWGARAMV